MSRQVIVLWRASGTKPRKKPRKWAKEGDVLILPFGVFGVELRGGDWRLGASGVVPISVLIRIVEGAMRLSHSLVRLYLRLGECQMRFPGPCGGRL